MVKQYFYTEVICKYCTYVGTNESTIRIANIMLKETLNKFFGQADGKSDGVICTNDLISVSLASSKSDLTLGFGK